MGYSIPCAEPWIGRKWPGKARFEHMKIAPCEDTCEDKGENVSSQSSQSSQEPTRCGEKEHYFFS